MGRPKLLRRKEQRHLSLACWDLVPALRAALSPPGVIFSDAQVCDIAIASMHEAVIGKRQIICQPEAMLDIVNRYIRQSGSVILTAAMEESGHTCVKVQWDSHEVVSISCDCCPEAKYFSGGLMDEERLLREIKERILA